MFRTSLELADLVNVVDVQSSLRCGDARDDAPVADSGARTTGTPENGQEHAHPDCCPPKPWRFMDPLQPQELLPVRTLDWNTGLGPLWRSGNGMESNQTEALTSDCWAHPLDRESR